MGYYLRKNVNTFTVRLNLKERSGLKEATHHVNTFITLQKGLRLHVI